VTEPEQRMPKAGEVLYLAEGCGVPWEYLPALVRVIRVHDWSTWPGMAWLDGYQLNAAGDAVERRSVYVQVAGIKWINLVRQPAPPPKRRPRNERATTPRLPRPRTPSDPITPTRRNG
jgi:hypothetical protein